jgi:hypothetical protein
VRFPRPLPRHRASPSSSAEAEHQAQRNAERLLQESLDRVLTGRPKTISIATRVIRGQPGPVLVEAARTPGCWP